MKKTGKFCISLILIFIISFSMVGCLIDSTDTDDGAQSSETSSAYDGNVVNEITYHDLTTAIENFDYSQIYEENYKAVVSISVSGVYESQSFFGSTKTQDVFEIGSGFIIDADGYVLTAFSLFDYITQLTEVKGYLFDGSSYTLEFLAYSINCDIALLRFTETVSYTDESGQSQTGMPDVVEFANSDNLEYGENCAYIATVSDDEDFFVSISEGIVSKPKNTASDFSRYINGYPNYEKYITTEYLIQTSITTNQGNEGCALFDSDGAVVGILSKSAESTTTFSSNSGYGMSFCVPSTTIYEFIEACQKDENKDYSDLSIDIGESSYVQKNYIANSETLKIKSDSVANNFYRNTGFKIVSTSDVVELNYQGNIEKDSSLANYIADNYQNFTVNVYSADSKGNSSGAGSGFIISSDGYVITNLHVVNIAASNQADNANQNVTLAGAVYCGFENGLIDNNKVVFETDIVAYDKVQDIAILKLKNTFKHYNEEAILQEGFEKICKFADYTKLCAGENVVAIGNALGYGSSVTNGVVSLVAMSAYKTTYGHEFIQTDCPINSGNSGGALFNCDGLVVGINSMGAPSYENVSWAIPSDCVTEFLDAVKLLKDSTSVFIVNATLASGVSYQ